MHTNDKASNKTITGKHCDASKWSASGCENGFGKKIQDSAVRWIHGHQKDTANTCMEFAKTKCIKRL